MSEAKHAPGPWTIDFDRPDFELDHPGQHPCVYAGRKVVASVGNMEPWVDVWEEWRANARLIAAAPDLLEALKPFAAAASQYTNLDELDQPSHGKGMIKQRHLHAALAAIAKATGETK